MLNRRSTTRRKSFSPLINLFIPIAFFLGLGGGYLIWGGDQASEAAGAEETRRVDVSTDDDPSIGPEDAAVTIIEFGDYQCPFCGSWYEDVFEQLMANYPGQIRYVYRDFPLSMHAEALPAAEAADCAGEQGAYWKYHDALFLGQSDLGREAYEKYAADLGLDVEDFTTCLDSHRYQAEVQADADAAASAGINSAPTFVINGRVLIGALPFADFKAVIDEELAAEQ